MKLIAERTRTVILCRDSFMSDLARNPRDTTSLAHNRVFFVQVGLRTPF